MGKGEAVDKLMALDALHRSGRELPVELTISPQRAPGGWQFNAFIRDVSERKRLEEERDRFNAELERSNEELEQFAYVASHDLTEPLRAIGGFVSLLQHRYRGRLDDQADRFIDAAVSGVERMEAMIDALLKLSRIGQTKIGAELVDCEQAVDQARLNLRRLIDERKADLQVGELPAVPGEPALIGEVFQNLIANAVKYGDPDSPTVSVHADRSNGEWVFSVEDNGAGIDPRQSARVFEMFKRLHDRDQAGAGIGLAISKRIVEKHGGRIWVEPRSDGGSAFRFAVPAGRRT
jgi:light-regulated signal transduction histidine kinase (bacteriophytochrome)